jgi:hypothetical protein
MPQTKIVFDPEDFYDFCEAAEVKTKELGTIRVTRELMMGTQKYFIEEIKRGLDEGIHDFVVLKGRQVAITTICLLLDLYWLGKYGGIDGAFVTQDEPTRDLFRTTFDQILGSLPAKWRIRTKAHNRTQMVIKKRRGKNENRMVYMVAGTRKNSGLGKSTASTFSHMTEVSEYGDEEGLASLYATFAQENPRRLFIQESTAQGYNHYYWTWQAAKHSKTTRHIFIGWWRNHFYRKKRGSVEHRIYWDGKMTSVERKWVREIKQIYDFDIDDEQIAWWRWMSAEKMPDEQLLFQNYPPTEDYAFVKSGSQFFNGERLNTEYKLALKEEASYYRFILTDNFETTELVKSSEKMATDPTKAGLVIWEHPVPGGVYAIGGDPARGQSEWSDRFVVQVFRCYSDGMDQVAEFCTTECTPAQFAWVICYLGGAYLSQPKSSGMLNLELNGPGVTVWNEMKNLRALSITSRTDAGKKIFSIVSQLQSFHYKRQDSMGQPSAFHTYSTTREKERMFSLFSGYFSRSMVKIRSARCLDEMRVVVREDDGFIGAPDRQKDDRVVGACLATTAWQDYLRGRLMSMRVGGLTRELAKKEEGAAGEWQPTNIQNFIQERLAMK